MEMLGCVGAFVMLGGRRRGGTRRFRRRFWQLVWLSWQERKPYKRRRRRVRRSRCLRGARWREVMIPVRDGVRLQTVIIAPAEQKEALPILFGGRLMACRKRRRNRCPEAGKSWGRTATSWCFSICVDGSRAREIST